MGKKIQKPKIGIFSFTSCEGCQLQILNLEDELPAIIERIDIVNFREAMTEKGTDYEIAFVEGSITMENEVEVIEGIRKQASVLIAIGACAALGGVNNLKNLHPKENWVAGVYKRDDLFTDTIHTKRISDVVKVDFTIPGCPIDKIEFLRFVNHLLIGIEPRLPNYPVCVECRSKGNVCIVEEDGWCLGSVTRAGCDAICPTFGESCAGCRGILEEANIAGLVTVLTEKGFSIDEIKSKFELYNQLEDIEVKGLPR
jgi:coenzyme F420-reducing hydrogenase gamma subunit